MNDSHSGAQIARDIDTQKAAYSVTYSINTEESTEHGDFEETGYIITRDDHLSLRDCIDELFSTRTNKVDGIQAMHGERHTHGGQFQITNGLEFETGAQEMRTLHFPHTITQASQGRLISLLLQR